MRGKKPPGPPGGPGISYEKLAGDLNPAQLKAAAASNRARAKQNQATMADMTRKGVRPGAMDDDHLYSYHNVTGNRFNNPAGSINPDSLSTKKGKVDRTLAGQNKAVDYVPSDVFSRAAGTAGHARDPISGQAMKKGTPVEAQSNSAGAQFSRRLGTALEPGFDRPGGSGGRKISKQLLAGSKPAKFDPKAFAKMRTDLKQEQGQAARIASRAPAKAPAPPKVDPLASAGGGLGSRKRLGNRLQGG